MENAKKKRNLLEDEEEEERIKEFERMEKAKKRKRENNDSFEEEQPQFVSISRKGKGKKGQHGKHIDEKKNSSSEVTDTSKRRASRINGDFVKETWETNRNTEAEDPMMGGGAKKSGLIVPQVKKRDKSDAIFNKGSGMLGTKQPNRNVGELHEDQKASNLLALPGTNL